MKTLYLIRHAKSSWDDAALTDFDRPLNDRGKRDAPRMGKWLKEQNEIPDLIVSSPAKRAKRTAEKIAEEVGYAEKKIEWEKSLYETTIPVWLKKVCSLPSYCERVYMVGHNDTLTWFVNYLTSSTIANVPTCGIVKIEFNTTQWAEISQGTGTLVWFQFPKNL